MRSPGRSPICESSESARQSVCVKTVFRFFTCCSTTSAVIIFVVEAIGSSALPCRLQSGTLEPATRRLAPVTGRLGAGRLTAVLAGLGLWCCAASADAAQTSTAISRTASLVAAFLM